MLEEIIQLIDTSINKAADLIIFCNDCLYAKVHLVITVFFYSKYNISTTTYTSIIYYLAAMINKSLRTRMLISFLVSFYF